MFRGVIFQSWKWRCISRIFTQHLSIPSLLLGFRVFVESRQSPYIQSTSSENVLAFLCVDIWYMAGVTDVVSASCPLISTVEPPRGWRG